MSLAMPPRQSKLGANDQVSKTLDRSEIGSILGSSIKSGGSVHGSVSEMGYPVKSWQHKMNWGWKDGKKVKSHSSGFGNTSLNNKYPLHKPGGAHSNIFPNVSSFFKNRFLNCIFSFE